MRYYLIFLKSPTDKSKRNHLKTFEAKASDRKISQKSDTVSGGPKYTL